MSQVDKKIAILESKIRKLEKENIQKEEVIQAQIGILDDYRKQINKQDMQDLKTQVTTIKTTGCSVCPLFVEAEWGNSKCGAVKSLDIEMDNYYSPITPKDCPLNKGSVIIKKLVK